MLLKNKKGGEKYLSIWWFFILVIISVGLIVGILANAFAEINVKKIESEILTDRVANCIIQQGQINKTFLQGNFDFYKNCNLNETIISGNNYIEISVFSFDSCSITDSKLNCRKNKKEIKYGAFYLKKNCEIIKSNEVKAPYFPGCIEKYIYALNSTEKLLVYIATGSNQVGGRT